MRARFSYSESDEIIYCSRCGQIAGEPTQCVNNFLAHDFTKTTVPVVCMRCGAEIGLASKCVNNFLAHDFCPI